MPDESGKPGGETQSESKTSTTYGAAAEGSGRSPQSSILCAKCGVQVAPGYPKCPKCHAPMPTVVSPLAKTSSAGGGTSAASASGGSLWIVVGAVVLIGGGLVVWKGRTADKSKAAQANAADGGQSSAAADGGLLNADDVFPDAGPQLDAAAYDLALDVLDGLLRERRLWSDVDVEPDDDAVVRIDTDMCGEDGLLTAVEETASRLAATGFTKVRCYSKHGRLVFEKPLE